MPKLSGRLNQYRYCRDTSCLSIRHRWVTSKRAPDRVASYQEAVILPELANTPGQPATPTSVSRWAVLAVLVVARLGVGFQFIAIAALMSDFRADLGADHAEIGVLLGIFMLTGIFLSLPSGMIAARFGDRRILLAGLAALSVGGLIVALSETVSVAILGRMVAGLGAVFTSVTAAKVVADRFVGREIATAMSFLGLAWPLGIAFGVSLLPILGDLSGWRLGIIATAVMPAVAAAVVVLLPMGSAAAPEKTDAPFWNLSRREFMLVSVCGLAWPLMATGGYVIFSSYAPSLLLEQGLSAGSAGMTASLLSWLVAAMIPIGGWLADRTGKGDLLVWLGCGVAAIAIAMVPLGGPIELWIVVSATLGLTVGRLMSLPTEFLSARSRATGMGVFYTIYYAGTAGLPVVAGVVLEVSGSIDLVIWFSAACLVLSPIMLQSYRMLRRF